MSKILKLILKLFLKILKTVPYRKSVKKFDKDRGKKFIVFSHELSLSGAPLMLLNLCKCIKNENVKVLFVSLSSGPLKNSIAKSFYCIPGFVSNNVLNKISRIGANYIIFNTIATLKILKKYDFAKGKKICWIHEGNVAFEAFKNDFSVKDILKLDKVLFVSEWSKKCFFERFNIELNYDIFNYGIEKENDINIVKNGNIVMVGEVNSRKNQIAFLREYIKFPNSYKEKHKLFVIGNVAAEIESELKCYRKENGIYFTGSIPHNKVLEMINDSSLLVCPSCDDPLPVVVTEALSFGTGVLVSDKTGHYSLLNSNFPFSTFELSKECDLCEIVRKNIDFYSIDSNRERLIELYKTKFTFEHFKSELNEFFREDTK